MLTQRTLFLGLPLLIFIGASVGTTGIGAVIFTVAPTELWNFIGSHDPIGAAQIGGLVYWELLIAPLALVPPVAIIAFAFGQRTLKGLHLKAVEFPISSASLFAVTAIGIGYCLYKMEVTGHLTLGVFQTLGGYEANMKAREAIIDDLHFVFFAVAYALIPLISCMFFARALTEGKTSDWVGLALNYLFFIYIIVSIYMKAPMMVFFLLMLVTVIFVRENWMYIVGLVVTALVTFVVLQSLLGGVTTAAPQAPPPTSSKDADTPERLGTFLASLHNSAASMPLNAAYRMASSYPFYIGMFSDPNERCGIQSNRIPLLPKPRCDLASTVFAKMYPDIRYVTGMAPQGAIASAYAAKGLPYSWLIIIFSGISIGILSVVAVNLSGLIGISVAISACAYSYYLTQVPFFGAITFSHGLFCFIFTIICVIIIEFIFRFILGRPEGG